MSIKLDWENIWISVKKYRIVFIAIGLLILIGFFLWLFSTIDTWWFWRGVKKDKQVIANHIQNVANLQKEISNLEAHKAAEMERARLEAERLLADQNATNAQRANTNAALEKMNEAINTNRGNVNAADIDKLLEQLK